MAVPRALALVALVLLTGACTSGRQSTRSATTTTRPPATRPATNLSTLVADVAPSGWVPVDFENAQVSVPADWHIGYDVPCEAPYGPGSIFIGTPPEKHICPSVSLARFARVPVVSIAPLFPGDLSQSLTVTRPFTINGITVRTAVQASASPFSLYWVPELGVTLMLSGPGAARVLRTLTHSPAAVALANAPAPVVPKTWKWVTGGNLRVAVPGSWLTLTSEVEGPTCSVELVLRASHQVVLDSDRYTGRSAGCAYVTPPTTPQTPQDGLVVDLHPTGGWPGTGTVGGCLHPHRLAACPYDRNPSPGNDQLAEMDILFLEVTVPGHASVEQLEIGLAGDGIVARTILYSLRAA